MYHSVSTTRHHLNGRVVDPTTVAVITRTTTTRNRPDASRFCTRAEHPNKRELYEFRDTEKDPRYQRRDMSLEHWSEFRLRFLAELEKGESQASLTELSLLVAAEDDALISHSSVKFPVEAYSKRLEKLTSDFQVWLDSLPGHDNAVDGVPSRDDSVTIDLLLEFLFGDSIGFTPWVSKYDTKHNTSLPRHSIVDHPGVWESPSVAYLHSVLAKKTGLSACLSIIVSDILQRLLQHGTISHFHKVTVSSQGLPGIELVDGIHENMNGCSFDALRLLVAHLKRSYWPFQWSSHDPYGGGFVGAAKTFLSGAESAESEAIARAAVHRLERGVWTSPGAGDIRRAMAACERLVLLHSQSMHTSNIHADARALEAVARRDLGVLFCHTGRFDQAKMELQRCKDLVGYKDLEHAIYVDKLLHILREVPIKPGQTWYTMESARKQCTLQQKASPQILPLTW